MLKGVKTAANNAGGVNLLLTALGALAAGFGLYQIGKANGSAEAKQIEENKKDE